MLIALDMHSQGSYCNRLCKRSTPLPVIMYGDAKVKSSVRRNPMVHASEIDEIIFMMCPMIREME